MTAEDVAAQLARERALRQADKMETIGRLTGAIAQQFNELLTAILTRTAALAQSLPPNRDLDELQVTAQRGAELVQRLLGFSRHHVLDLQPLILTEFVRDALDSLGRQLPANIEVQFEADEDGGVVEADPAAVKQVLLHLVTNARDAMRNGGTLHVEVRRARLGAADRPLHAWVEPGSYVSVALSDTGVGMDAETLARVFEPFFTTKPVGVGTGLGMSMAYGLVKQHRGYLHIDSEVGQGTTAKVYLPRVRYRAMLELESAAVDCERAARAGEGAAGGYSPVASLFLFALPVLRLLRGDVGDGVPGVVNPDEQQEQRRRTNQQEAHRRVLLETERRHQQRHVRDERKDAVPQPVFQHRRVARLPARPPDDDRHVHDSRHTHGGEGEPGVRDLAPRHAQDRRHEQHRAEMHDGGGAKGPYLRPDPPRPGAEHDHDELQTRQRRGRRADDHVEVFPGAERR